MLRTMLVVRWLIHPDSGKVQAHASGSSVLCIGPRLRAPLAGVHPSDRHQDVLVLLAVQSCQSCLDAVYEHNPSDRHAASDASTGFDS